MRNPLPTGRRLTYTESATVDMELIVRRASLDGGTVMVPAFFCRNLFERIFDRHDVEPLFVDVDPETYHMDPDLAEEYVQDVDAVLLLHTFGLPAAMDRWTDLAREGDAVLIEDCARALGARYDDRPVGSFGRYAFFSMAKTTPLAFGGVFVSPLTEGPVDLAPYRFDADRFLRTLYNLVPWDVPLEDRVAAIYADVLGDDTSTAPEVGDVDPPEADVVRRLDPLNRWLFERYLRRDFAERIVRQNAVAAELRDVLTGRGIDVQSDAPGRVNYLLTATVPDERDELVEYLKSRDYAVDVVWDDPWSLAYGDGTDRERFPVAADLADRVLSFYVPQTSLDDVRRLERDLEAF